MMTISKTRCLILESNSKATYFDEVQGTKKQTTFSVDPSRTIQAIVMQEMYVIVVYENSVAVYNSNSGDKLEERPITDPKQFKFKVSACVNYKGSEVYMIAQNNSSGKNTVQSEVHQLMEIPPENQIEFLLSTGRIKEAKDIFLTKVNKGGDFQNKLKQLNIDAGWVALIQYIDYEQVITNFKQTDIDPREIILLFKELYETSPRLARDQLLRAPSVFIPKIVENYMNN
jgi:hypothetical protein